MMLPRIDAPRALLRGRYAVAAASMEWHGTPIDVETFARLRDGWDSVKAQLVSAVDERYGVFVPAGRNLDPATRFGSAILDAAQEADCDPYQLADAAEYIAGSEREMGAERLAAIRAARAATGLTANRVAKFLDNGKDYADVHGLDVQARDSPGLIRNSESAAATIPMAPTKNNTAELWRLLAEPDPVPRPRHHPDVIREAVEMVDPGKTVTRGPLRFSSARWADYLVRAGIPWPQLESGELALDDDTFREMARLYPAEIGPMRELRHAIGQLRLNELAVGADGRNRLMLSMFGSKTGRNQPSNSRFVFGPSCWLRSLIQPAEGRALAYVDWSAQEWASRRCCPATRECKRLTAPATRTFGSASSRGCFPPTPRSTLTARNATGSR